MRPSKLIIISLALFVVAVVGTKQCTYDYECGNIPYAYCYNGAEDCTRTTLGVALSSSDDRIYYSEYCRSPDNPYYVKGTKENITIKAVSLKNGKINNIYSETHSRSGSLGGVFGKVGDSLYIERYNRYTGLDSFNVKTLAEKGVILKFYDSVAFASDTYACIFNKYGADDDYRRYYNINKYAGAVQSTAAKPTAIYSVFSGYCGGMYTSGTTIYFSFTEFDANETEISIVYKGTTACRGCQPPAPLFTVKGDIGGITADPSNPNKIYFGSNLGIYSYSLSTNAIDNLTADASEGVIAFYKGSIIYNTGSMIRKVNISSKKVADINGKKVGSCKCAPGFKGDQCNECSGQIQWYQTSPSCVATNSAGLPETCTQDWQCGNMPYTVCYGDCQCRDNFTGPKCDQCAGTISWEDETPYCSLP